MWLEVALCVDPKLEDVFNSMTPPFTRDQWHIHDPSRVVAVSDDLLMIANTGKAQRDLAQQNKAQLATNNNS